MKLGKAYETLKDESKRKAYDLIYPSIKRTQPYPQTTKPPRAPDSQARGDAAQIASLEKSKQDRGKQWSTTKIVYETLILKLQAEIRQLKQEIGNLESIAAAEAVKKARENSWGTWLLSPLYKKVEDSEEEKERKERERQERRIQKDWKERRLDLKTADLKKQETLLKTAKEDLDAVNRAYDREIQDIRNRIWAREYMERQAERERVYKETQERERVVREERERVAKEERERTARIRKQEQEKREREAAEILRRQEEENKKRQKILDELARAGEQSARHNVPDYFSAAQGSTSKTSQSACIHGGWWAKVQGRTACPRCYEVWTYLLQCPGCDMKACPKCQSVIRPRVPRSTARMNRRAPPRVRTPSPVSWNTYDYDYD